MKKKVLISVVLIVALISSVVYATESNLAPTTDASTLQAMPLVGEEDSELTPTTDANTLQDTKLVKDTETTSEDYVIPEEWRRDASENVAIENATTNVMSDDFQSEDTLEIKNKSVDGNAFYSGKEIIMNNVDISGDLFVVAEKITLKNVYISGNIYAAGKDITLQENDITGNAYLASATITLTGTTVQDVFSASESLVINSNTYVRRTINAGASNIDVSNSSIGRNMNVATSSLVVGENARVTGSLNYSAKEEASVAPNATIGKVNFKQITDTDETAKKADVSSIIYSIISTMVYAALICGFIVLFANGFVEKQKVENVVGHIAKNTGIGLLLAIVVPILSIVLICTGVAAGFALLLLVLYFVIFSISLPIVAVSITAASTKQAELSKLKFYGITLLVALMIAILSKIPFVGGFVSVVITFAGMGLVFSGLKAKKEKKEVEPTVEA